jgi:acetolactate synthase-1/2/3 large subunit
MTNPDFAALARSYGGYGERVDKAEDFAAAFRRAVDSGLPAVLHLPQDSATRSPKTASN